MTSPARPHQTDRSHPPDRFEWARRLLGDAGLVEPPVRPGALRLVIAGTSDLHGHVRSWDYYTDTPDATVGLTKVASLVKAARALYGDERVVLLDAGDTIAGSPLTWYAATGEVPGEHPMAAAMRELGYAAAALGNHDVEYGFHVLDRFIDAVDFPILGANTSGERSLPAGLVLTRRVAGFPPVRLGILGLTNPGIAVWTKDVVAGRLEVGDIIAAARVGVNEVLAEGADAVVAVAHTGTCPFSSYADVVPWLENAALPLAEQVPQIAAVLAGHAHADIGEIRVPRPAAADVADAVLTEPACYGQRLSLIHLDLVPAGSGWRVAGAHAQTLDASVAEEDLAVRTAVAAAHEATRALLAQVLGRCDGPLDLADAPWRSNPALELIAAVAGGEAMQHLPERVGMPARTGVLAVVSPLRRQTRLEAGELRARDLAALYRFDNKLVAVELTGAELHDYLEWSARYFRPASAADWHGGVAPPPAQLLGNPVPDAPRGLPDYDYDIAIGVDGVLTYEVDCARSIGHRVGDLRFDDAPVRPDEVFVVLVTGYRANGSRNYPHVARAPVRWRSDGFVRAMLAAHLQRVGQLRVAGSNRPGWRLTVDGVPVAGNVGLSRPVVS